MGNDFSAGGLKCSPPALVASPPAVAFDGATQCMGVGSNLGIPAGSARTVYVVGRYLGLPQNAGFFFAQSVPNDPGAGPNQYAMEATKGILSGAPGDRFSLFVTGSRFFVDAPVFQTTSTAVHTLVAQKITASAGIQLAYRYNGNVTTLTLGSGSTGNAGSSVPAPNETAIGGMAVSSTRFYGQVEIREVLAYDRAHATGDLAAVEAYLKARHGL